jgi:hypothetical protein
MQKGFFESLFDFSFSSFVTTSIIKIVYAILILAVVVGAIGYFITAVQSNFLIALIVTPISLILGLIGARIYCELIIVVFRLAQYTGEIKEMMAKKQG